MVRMKQCIVVCEDLGLSKGKLAVQVAHASLMSYECASEDVREQWKQQGQKKVVLKVETLDELLRLAEDARRLGLPHAIVRDAGLTEIPEGTITALGIGPAPEDEIDKVTGKLKLL
ncbi:MAG: peptidyl-tRNA hydrolase Pth2 [Canidatus Methanoxibalbensis ujae]|nr:peptidyl-tRNA hydrolase Pth2 [Candidatus Methanoxibalbensis ujae]